jgi:hypothetical protein
LKIRDVFPNSILLEGADFKAGDNQYSFIAMQPVASFKATGNHLALTYPDGSQESIDCKTPGEMTEMLISLFYVLNRTFLNGNIRQPDYSDTQPTKLLPISKILN